jgi:hypothetical protein
MGTVDPIEVIWTLAALPGLTIWAINRATAARSLKAVKKLGVGNGRLIVARYGVFKADVFIGVSSVFALVGVVAMLRAPNPDGGWDWVRVLLTIGLLGAPAMIAVLGFRWRVVEKTIVKMALLRQKPPADTP